MLDSGRHRREEATRGHEVEALVTVQWLREQRAPDTVLLQVDGDSAAYHAAHLPGALPLDWHDEMHEQVRRGPVSQQHFENLMRSKGIGTDTHVVLCGGEHISFAAHAFWLFRYYGHRRLSLLDGGLQAWERAGGALEETVPDVVRHGDYHSPGPDETVRVQREEMVSCYVGAPEPVVILDCRTPQEYAGRHRHPLDLGVEHHRVSGHIPGARNLPSGQLLQDDGTLQPLEELRALFAAQGVEEGSDVVVYCRVAERSSMLWFTLHELLNHPRVRHYDGGWAEYGSLLDVPVERHP